jgi:hypothetical protein
MNKLVDMKRTTDTAKATIEAFTGHKVTRTSQVSFDVDLGGAVFTVTLNTETTFGVRSTFFSIECSAFQDEPTYHRSIGELVDAFAAFLGELNEL